MYYIDLAVTGISFGCMYAMMSVGLTLVYGLLRILHVAHAAVGLQFFQPINIPLDELAQFSFNGEAFFEEILDAQNFIGGQVLSFFAHINFRGNECAQSYRTANAVQISEGDLDSLVIRNIYAKDTHGFEIKK